MARTANENALIALAPKWADIRGHIVEIAGINGIKWFAESVPYSKETDGKGQLISLLHGTASLVIVSTLRSWLGRGWAELSDEAYTSWQEAALVAYTHEEISTITCMQSNALPCGSSHEQLPLAAFASDTDVHERQSQFVGVAV